MKLKTKTLTTLALLVALTVILGVTPIGYIPLFAIEITIMCIPVIIGTILLGWKSGLILGFAFGVTSLIQAFVKPTPLLAPLLDYPLVLVASVFIPRLLIPVTTWGAYRLLKKAPKGISIGIASAAGSLTNTVFFLGLIILLGSGPVAAAFDMTKGAVALTLGGIALTNGLPEAAAAIVLCVPIVMALRKAIRI